MAAKFKKLDFLEEACKTTSVNVRCVCKDLTLLINACDEAASYRFEHKLPYAEKYAAMSDKLRLLNEELEQRIASECERLRQIARKS